MTTEMWVKRILNVRCGVLVDFIKLTADEQGKYSCWQRGNKKEWHASVYAFRWKNKATMCNINAGKLLKSEIADFRVSLSGGQ